MLYKCPKCKTRLRPIRYKKGLITRHYFVCECGFSTKPQELKEKENTNHEE